MCRLKAVLDMSREEWEVIRAWTVDEEATPTYARLQRQLRRGPRGSEGHALAQINQDDPLRVLGGTDDTYATHGSSSWDWGLAVNEMAWSVQGGRVECRLCVRRHSCQQSIQPLGV